VVVPEEAGVMTIGLWQNGLARFAAFSADLPAEQLPDPPTR